MYTTSHDIHVNACHFSMSFHGTRRHAVPPVVHTEPAHKLYKLLYVLQHCMLYSFCKNLTHIVINCILLLNDLHLVYIYMFCIMLNYRYNMVCFIDKIIAKVILNTSMCLRCM